MNNKKVDNEKRIYKKPEVIAQELKNEKCVAGCIRPDLSKCCECQY